MYHYQTESESFTEKTNPMKTNTVVQYKPFSKLQLNIHWYSQVAHSHDNVKCMMNQWGIEWD